MKEKNCTKCLNAKWCAYIHPYRGFYCAGMETIIDNHRPRKEPLASDLIGEGYEGFTNRNYLDVINEGMELKQDVHDISMEDIKSMPFGSDKQATAKAIMSLMWFGLPKSRIMRLLGIGRTFFYEIVKATKEDYNK